MKKYSRILLLLILFLLSGCFGSYYEPEPVGIGKGSDELKLSPCACMEIELPKTLPDWFVATI
ncbi:MAG: lipoprotein [Proteobacteria bacterium]|nr:lipoprotein [Pseudomonadota bacterium]